jgi:ubiquinone/menaquinone biosynthesis C-methylase UbiE
VIRRYLEQTPPGELVLELGGGDRRTARPGHVNFEYLDYELADAYGDIHSLPFADDAFGLVCSQAVFEHVRDPFQAAEELTRVTRPGGLIITEVAFLQPLHAVPYHYFNMTGSGVEALFPSCDVVESDWFGPLAETVEWLLRAANLTDKVPQERLAAIEKEFVAFDELMSHEDLKAVASGVYLVVRKPFAHPPS